MEVKSLVFICQRFYYLSIMKFLSNILAINILRSNKIILGFCSFLFLAVIISITSMSFVPIKKPTVYIIVSEECPICIHMTLPLKNIHQKYKDKVNFKLIFPVALSNYKTMVLFQKKYGLENFEGIIDEDQSITKKLGATVTPEAIVENKNSKIIYRGRINDDYFSIGRLRKAANKSDLTEAIDAALSDKSIELPWPKAIGCYITFNK
jgi:thiol-disulfide isomerase/thioredoxin